MLLFFNSANVFENHQDISLDKIVIMETENFRNIWEEAIRSCELEQNEEKAKSFVMHYCDNDSVFKSMNDRNLLLTFVRLVVYEKKCQIKLGSTTPASLCYSELLKRVDNGSLNREFIYDVGDWAADYSDNGYIPMGNYRGYGPRRYYSFRHNCELRLLSEQQAKEERIAKKRAEGQAKVEAAKRKHQDRINNIQLLKAKSVDECLSIIEQSGKSVFYYYELIEEWFLNNALSDIQKGKVLDLFPNSSTRHNNRKRRYLEALA